MNIYVLPIELSKTDLKALKKSMEDFHSVQSEFKLIELDAFPYEGDTINWEHLAKLIKSTHPDKEVIGVTSKGFDDNWFSHLSENVCAVSVFEWNKYFSPPGPQCFLLSKLALAAYFFVTKLNEESCEPHFETEGCLFDMCENKADIIWKLKVGVLCNNHVTMFRNHGGNDSQLEAIELLLDEVRRVTLGKQEAERKKIQLTKGNSKQKKEATNVWQVVGVVISSIVGTVVVAGILVIAPLNKDVDEKDGIISEQKKEVQILAEKLLKYQESNTKGASKVGKVESIDRVGLD